VGKGVIGMTESFQRKPQVGHGIAYDTASGLKGMFKAKAAGGTGQLAEHQGRGT
jgi:hypothetical protein